jgi:hypothetical protein
MTVRLNLNNNTEFNKNMINKIKIKEEIKLTKTLNNVSDIAGETIKIKRG